MRKTLIISIVASLGLLGCGEKDDGGNDTGVTGGSSGGDGDGDGDGGSDGGDGDGDSDGGSVFIVEPDGGGTGVECDVWNQDCPDGQKCMPWANDGGNSWNATKCSPVDANPNQVGDDCTTEGGGVSGVDTCDQSMMCWNVDADSGLGYCVAFCEGSPDSPTCSNPDNLCSIYNDGVLPLCLPKCDPLLQDCPTDRDVCVNSADGIEFVCVLDASGEAGVYGDPCEFVNVCDAGLFCAAPANVPGCASTGCCSPFCDMTDMGATCPDGMQECVAWYAEGEAPPGREDVGFCGIPA